MAMDSAEYAVMKPLRRPPPLLLGCALLFWGFETGFLLPALIMAVIIEIAPKVPLRMEFSDDDFSRIWTFCTLLFLASAVYAFTSNEGVSNFRGLLQDPSLGAQRSAGASSARTAASLIRWLPMTLFLFIAAQAYSPREGIPLTTISLLLRKRWLKAKARGESYPTQSWNVGFPFVGVCLFAASTHGAEGTDFFWGACGLLAWALWSARSRRFAFLTWALAVGLAVGLGYFGQGGIGRIRLYLESLNPAWLSSLTRRGFDPAQTKTQIGQLGRLKTSGKILIRLEPKEGSMAPSLLREAVYRSYKAQSWASAFSGKADYEGVLAETNGTTFVLVPGKENLASVSIACYLDGGRGLLPIPETSGRLENLSAFVVQKNAGGSVVAEGPGLVIFDALFGPGQTLDSPPSGEEDLAVPVREQAALETIANDLKLDNASTDQKIRAVNAFFASNFKYSTYQEKIRIHTNETALSRFLLRTHSGHCEYFATATVLLLRQLHVPTRYAVGYAVHEASGKKYVVRQRDGHAWCLAWNDRRHTWQDVDTTPAIWVEAEASHSPTQFISDAWSRVMFEFAKWRWGQTRMRRYILYALAPVLALLFYQIISRAKKQRRHRNGSGAASFLWPGRDSEIYQLEKRLAYSGVPRSHYEPLDAWLARVTRELRLSALEQDFKNVALLHNRYRFDPHGLSPNQRSDLKSSVQNCLGQIDRALPGSAGAGYWLRQLRRRFKLL
jgi:transglutaminase-like putative cysteine protease